MKLIRYFVKAVSMLFASSLYPSKKTPFDEIDSSPLYSVVLKTSLHLPSKYGKPFRVGASLGYCAAMHCMDNFGDRDRTESRDYLDELLTKSLGILATESPEKAAGLITSTGEDLGYDLAWDQSYAPLLRNGVVQSRATHAFGYVMQHMLHVLVPRAMYMNGDESVTCEMLDELGETADAIERMSEEQFTQLWGSEVNMD